MRRPQKYHLSLFSERILIGQLHRFVRDAADAFAMHVKLSPPAAITVEILAPEEHEKHDDDQNGCHKLLQQVSATRRGTGTRLVQRLSCYRYRRPFFRRYHCTVGYRESCTVGIGRIVAAIAVRGAIGARITGIVPAAGIVVAIALGWIFCVPDAPA